MALLCPLPGRAANITIQARDNLFGLEFSGAAVVQDNEAKVVYLLPRAVLHFSILQESFVTI